MWTRDLKVKKPAEPDQTTPRAARTHQPPWRVLCPLQNAVETRGPAAPPDTGLLFFKLYICRSPSSFCLFSFLINRMVIVNIITILLFISLRTFKQYTLSKLNITLVLSKNGIHGLYENETWTGLPPQLHPQNVLIPTKLLTWPENPPIFTVTTTP